MGLRTASARRPHVMVMAPALTKPTQSNGFNKLTNSSPTKSPATSLSTRTSDDQNDVYNSLEGEPCRNLVELDHIDLENAADNLNTLALVSEILKKNSYLSSVEEGDSGANILELGGIMNSNPLHMGDDTDKMGLQKTAGLDVNCFKDRSSTSDVDQLIFNNIGAGLPDTDIGNDIGSNVEDLMQVFKSIGSGSDRLEGGESDSMFPLSSADLPGSFSSLEKELFNDVDVMSMSMEEQLLDGANTFKETHTKEFLANLQKKHTKLERKLQFMMRRLRKVQAKHMGQHFSEEVAGIYEQVHRSLRRAKDGNSQFPLPQPQPDQLLDPLNFSVASMPNLPVVVEKLKPISKNSAKNLVRKLELSTSLQANAVGRQRHTTRYFGSGSVETNSLRSSLIGATIIPQWNPDNVRDLQRVTGCLHTEMRLVQQDLDSEATVSSSGGESCDEMQSYNNSHQQFLAIQKRAAWRYAVERAAIASRWTWLKAQIGDLEYRIRQYSDLYKQIRASKGSITLGGESPPQNIPTSPTIVNGYRGQLPGASPVKSLDLTANGTVPIPEFQCTRTRPLVNFRKRKLLQTWGLHAVSKKAARPATMRCGCVPPGLQCALCTGRTDPTRPRDLPDYLSTTECISRLDSSFHPVFSLLEDASASTHFDAIMKTSEWQHKSSKPNMKIAKYVLKGTDKSSTSSEHQPKKPDHRRKYNRLIKPSTINALTAKIKNKFRGRKPGVHSALSRIRRKRHSEKLSSHLQTTSLESGAEEHEQVGSSRAVKSRSSSPLLSMQTIPSGYKRNSRISSYDIDNIVIPYSVAASTRVEKLQYKEILTPKWRIVESDFGSKVKSNGLVMIDPGPESDNEDLLEEAVLLRHEKSELEERKKFLSYMKFPYGYSRSRAHKRIDSRAESSGCNTPDPMSPHAGENLENIVSPLTSPPATPLSASNMEEGGSSSIPSINVLRKRTISQSRSKDKEALKEEVCANLPENDEVSPYEIRLFPIDDITYDHMLKLMPENHQFKTNYRAQDCTSPSSYLGERANSPADSESTESAVGDEDPNDPEWLDMESIKDRYRR